MTFEEDAKIVEDSTRLRLAELEVEKTKINANAEVRKQRVMAFNNIGSTSGLIIIFLSVLSLLGMTMNCHHKNIREKTKQLPELTLQKIEETRQLEEKTRQLNIVLDIARHSETDELAIKAFETFVGPKEEKK